MSTWQEWANDNMDRGLCRSCTEPARIDENGRTMIYCARHALRESARQAKKRGAPTRKHGCSICGEKGHDVRTHDLHQVPEAAE